MPKFSIVIPVYNVEKYIKRTLDSVINQSDKDYEIIAVNDGCTDSSMEIVKKYDLKIINSVHVGVSEARNIGAKQAKGEYLVFLDSDDWWDKDLLKEINKSLDNNPDLVRFQARTVTDDDVRIDYNEEEFRDLSGEEAFNKIVKFHFIDSIWCYAIKRKYYEKEKFKFKKDTVHEDFGLTPLIVIKASKVNSINYIGYNYYRRNGSIMNIPDYNWTKRKVKDLFNHYLYLDKEIDKIDIKKDIFKSYIANNTIMKICELKGKDYKEYKKRLKEEKVYDNLLTDTTARKVKKIMYKISPKLTIKFIK